MEMSLKCIIYHNLIENEMNNCKRTTSFNRLATGLYPHAYLKYKRKLLENDLLLSVNENR